MKLHLEELGPAGATGRALVLLHGFTGSAASWRPFAWSRRAVAVDLVGHGRSPKPDDATLYRAESQVGQLLAVLDRLDLGQVDLVGYSMGGRLAMQLAVALPQRVRNLVLESASPGIVDPAERAARVASDEKLAQLAESSPIETFVDRWERAPLFASQERLPAGTRARLRAQRLGNDPRGLAASLRGFGAGVPEPLWERPPAHRTLLIVGALDEKYCALGRAMAEWMADARLEIVPNAGHTIHLEQPAAFERLVHDFLGD